MLLGYAGFHVASARGGELRLARMQSSHRNDYEDVYATREAFV